MTKIYLLFVTEIRERTYNANKIYVLLKDN